LNPTEAQESKSASVIAELFGTVGPEQRQAIFNEALATKKGLEGRARSTSDDELLAFETRVLWAGKILNGGQPGFEMLSPLSPSGQKFEAFRAALFPEVTRVTANKAEYHDLVRRINAATSDDERKALQEELKRKFPGHGAFLEGQAKAKADSVSQQVAEDLAKALSVRVGKSHYFDTTDADGVAYRAELPADSKKYPEAVRQMGAQFGPFKNGGFGRQTFQSSPHGNFQGNFFRPQFEGGTAPPTPPSGTPTQTPVPSPTPSPTPSVPGAPPAPAPEADAAALTARMLTLLKDKGCVGCHSKTTGPNPRLFARAGEEVSFLNAAAPQSLLTMLEKKTFADDSTMEEIIKRFKGALTDDEKTLVRAWAKSQGKDPLDL
jgi:hypothetical protein